MISNMVNGEADLSIYLTICCGRHNAVDYSWTLSEAASGFGIKSKRLCFQHLILEH